MKAVILAGGLGTLISEETHLESRNDFMLILAGGGDLGPQVADKLRSDPILARIVLAVGFVSQDIVYALRRQCALSLCLMGGFSLIEACAAGRPVVAYDVEWHHELVVEGETGRLVPEHDVVGVTDAIAALLDDSVSADRMGAAARERAFTRHSLPVASEVRRRAYRDVLAIPSGTPA